MRILFCQDNFFKDYCEKICRLKNNVYLCTRNRKVVVVSSSIIAEIAQLVEHNLAKVGVASSSLVFRSNEEAVQTDCFFRLTR